MRAMATTGNRKTLSLRQSKDRSPLQDRSTRGVYLRFRPGSKPTPWNDLSPRFWRKQSWRESEARVLGLMPLWRYTHAARGSSSSGSGMLEDGEAFRKAITRIQDCMAYRVHSGMYPTIKQAGYGLEGASWCSALDRIRLYRRAVFDASVALRSRRQDGATRGYLRKYQ